jgi:hypothetical protein
VRDIDDVDAFDAFVIVASAFGGAAMLMAGAHSLFPGVRMFDRAAGGLVPTIVTFVLTLIGISWQFKNMAAAIRSTPLYSGTRWCAGLRACPFMTSNRPTCRRRPRRDRRRV